MKKSISYDQNKIKIICDQLCDRIEDLLDHLNLEYKSNNRFISMSCPIHGGDNPGALNLYHTGDTYRGNWKCRTHKCEEIFKSSIIGFIRGILSNRELNWSKDGDSACSFQQAMEYAMTFLDVSLEDIKVSKGVKDKNIFVNNVNLLQHRQIENTPDKISRNTIRRSLQIPSSYFLSRNFSKDILDKYDVGDCTKKDKEMYNRAVVPVYDIDHEYMVGCTGRSIFEKCESCGNYHTDNCPSLDGWKFSKWRHSSGFKTQQFLYNYWYAKDHILKDHTIILVESPGNVWKLEEYGIHNSVALFGANLTDRQKTILDMSGAMTIITIMDNDDAGKKAAKLIYDKCYKTYNIKNITISKNDIADMDSLEIEQQIGRHL